MADLIRSEEGINNAFSAFKVAVEGGGDIAEEKFEQAFATIDLNWLLRTKGVGGTAARVLNAIPADMRLAGLSMTAAYINSRHDINPYLRFLLVAALRAAPQGITAMFAERDMDEAALAAEIDAQVVVVEGRELYVGPKRTDLVHDVAIHPPDADAIVNRGSLRDILQRFERNVLCPDCFYNEAPHGRILIDVPAEGPKGALFTLAMFADNKRLSFEAVEALAKLEVDGDHGLGLEGEANQILAAHAEALKSDPKGLEAMLPDSRTDAETMFTLAGMTREQIEGMKKPGESLLPFTARRYIRSLLAAYRVKHPISNVEARAKDWGDTLIDWVPTSLKPKEKGWAGVNEMFSTRLGVGLAITLMIILTIFVWMIWGAHNHVTRPLLQAASDTVGGIKTVFGEHMTPRAMMTEKAIATLEFGLLLFPALGFFPGFRNKVEEFRPRVLTVRLVLTIAGLVMTILLWGTGDFKSTGVAFLTTTLWIIALVAEFTNKYAVKFRPDWMTVSVERFALVGSALATVTLVIGLWFFSTQGTNSDGRAQALAAGIGNRVEAVLAKQFDIELPPTAAELAEQEARAATERAKCDAKLAEVSRVSEEKGTTVQKVCAVPKNFGTYTCKCLRTAEQVAGR